MAVDGGSLQTSLAHEFPHHPEREERHGDGQTTGKDRFQDWSEVQKWKYKLHVGVHAEWLHETVWRVCL